MPHSPGVEGVGLGHRLVAADRREGVDLEVALLEPSQRRLHLRSGGGRAGTHGGRDVDGGLLGLGHVHPVRLWHGRTAVRRRSRPRARGAPILSVSPFLAT